MRIVVFDSGLGSLSIIKPIQKICKSEIIYFADQKNFPYGKKSKKELSFFILNSIKFFEKYFKPDLIVLASNTPSIILNIKNNKVLGVTPPLKEASKITKTKNIAILGTKITVESKELTNYIKKQKISSNIIFHKINCSELVSLVESGKFIKNKSLCKKIIFNLLDTKFSKNNIDVAILASTHLPFLQRILSSQFKNIKFIEPGPNIAKQIKTKVKLELNQNKLKIYSNINNKSFQNKLKLLRIFNKVNFLDS